jgi:3-methyladenine DNA glycosylase AlkD
MPAATAQAIVKELKPLGSEGYSTILRRHGIRDPVFGVKISELKKIQRRVKKDYSLALELYATGVYDAMYLAGLIADDLQMTKKDLQRWINGAYCTALGNCTVAWTAAQGRFGHELAMKWLESKKPVIAAAGWSTLSSLAALVADAQLDVAELKALLQRVGNTIHTQPDAVRYAMNGFVIAVGSYVKPLTADAIKVANKMGAVTVAMGDTACKVADAASYINKVRAHGSLGKKRKTVKC